MLRHAIEQAYHASKSVAAAALLIHCRDDTARDFYLANGNFLASPVEPTHLMLSMKEIGRRLGLAPLPLHQRQTLPLARWA